MATLIDPTAKVSELAVIDVSTRGTDTHIGAHSVVDDFVKIKHVGGDGHVIIGKYAYLNSFTTIYSGNGVAIGDHVLIGPNCSIVPVDHEFGSVETPIRLQGFRASKGGITISDDVWIGAGVTILDGAHIGRGVIVGAGSVVRGALEEYGIYAGTPVKKIGTRR